MQLRSLKHRGLGLYASPWLVIGASCILAVVVAVFAGLNINREKRYMSQILSEKGAALIKAIEAGARTGLRGVFGENVRLATLVEETAKLPDILFIAITDSEGSVLIHSDPSKIGTTFAVTPALEGFDGAKLNWRLVEEAGGRKAFMAYRNFDPRTLPPHDQQGALGFPPPPEGRLGGGRRGRGPQGWRQGAEAELPPPPPASVPPQVRGAAPPGAAPPGAAPDAPALTEEQLKQGGKDEQAPFFCTEPCLQLGPARELQGKGLRIFVGMDVAPFESARAEDFQHTLLISAILLASGFGGVVSLFWAHSYRISRRQLLDTRALASEVVANLPVGCVVTDREGRIVLVNPEASRIAAGGAPVSPGAPASNLLPPALLALAPSSGAEPAALDKELECVFEQGGKRPVPLRASATGIVTEENEFIGQLFILSDLREVRRLEEQVRRSEKLAAVGNLAAGVAHEIRNPLSSIKGYATFFRGKFPPESEEAEAAQIMAREVDRLNRVISELLEFARPSDLKLEPVDLPELVEHALKLVRPDAEHNQVRVEVKAAEDLPLTPVDPDRISQALLNLFLNAIQAMPEGGALSVRLALEGNGQGERRAVVEIADQGQGIEAEHLAKIFDPYFTTKGAGTGLGLAIVHKIIEAHRGEIKVASAKGKGSVFTLRLPLDASDSPQAARKEFS
jgi:two-component system sensor histidine kinase HydH